MIRDWYQVLGLDRDAPPAAVRAAYVRLVKLHHPDHARKGVPPSEWLSDVRNAYRTLSDPEGRAALDRALADRDRRHAEALRRVQRRLRGYDRRHPRRPPVRRRWRRWRRGLAIACAAAVIVPLSAMFLG